MAYKSGKCWCCHRKRPVEGHHQIPLSYGGAEDQPLVDICADCHSIIHKEAEYYHKHGRFQDLDYTIPYEPEGFGERIRILIAKIINAKNAFNAGLMGVSQQRRMTQLSWDSEDELKMAHAVKEAMHFKSLERAIKTLVLEKYIEFTQGKRKGR